MKQKIAAGMFSFLLLSCSGSSDSLTVSTRTQTGGNQNVFVPPPKINESFDCNGKSCDSADQYCLLTKAGDIYLSTECLTKPVELSDCTSAESAAREHFKDSKNCSNLVSCFSHNDIFTVTCYIPNT